MDWELVMIFSFVMTMVLIVFGFARTTHRRSIEHEERKLDLLARAEEARASQSGKGNADYRKLEERVRVLERIATDGNHALAAQIEQLRDFHEIEEFTQTRESAQ